jgi:hypothetical protein
MHLSRLLVRKLVVHAGNVLPPVDRACVGLALDQDYRPMLMLPLCTGLAPHYSSDALACSMMSEMDGIRAIASAVTLRGISP